MLELKGDQAKVANVNYRIEKHGEKEVPALDIDLSINMAPSVLDQLVPGLREAMFKPKDPSKPEAGLSRCFPQLGQLKIGGEWPGYRVSFQRGEISDTRIDFEAAKLHKIRAVLVEGGSVTLQIQLQIGGEPDYLERAVPLLALTLPTDLTPPYGDDLVDQAQNKSPKAGNAENQAAGGLPTPKPPAADPFIEGDGGDPPEGFTDRTAEGLAEADRDIAERRDRLAAAGVGDAQPPASDPMKGTDLAKDAIDKARGKGPKK